MSLPDAKLTSRLPKGEVLDQRFKIIKFLGAGSFGEVYLAKQLVFGHAMRDVALKLFSLDATKSENYYETFADAVTLVNLQESDPPEEVARRLIQVYDVGVVTTPGEDGPCERAFMSMKLIRGGLTLENTVKQFDGGKMLVDTSLERIRQLLIPLAWMHQHPLGPFLHCDIKPDNILLSEDKELVILTDFGLAVNMNIGALGGAVIYQSPEQLTQVKTQGPQADVYAVGLVWYELLTGEHPFRDVGVEANIAGDTVAYLDEHRKARKWEFRERRGIDDFERLVPPSEFNSDLKEHPQVELLLQQCLAYRASDRPVHAGKLKTQIESYMNGQQMEFTHLQRSRPTKTEEIVTQTQAKRGPEHHVKNAEALRANNQPGRAAEEIELALSEVPELLSALLVKSYVLTDLKQHKDAFDIIAELIEKYPKTAGVYEALGFLYEQSGRPGAEEQRQKAARLRR